MQRRRRGDLERAVLRVLWEADEPVSATWVRDRFEDDDRPALTTVLTVLTRLVDKGAVERTGSARSQRFAPTRTEAQAAAGAMEAALATTADRPSALQEFAGRLDQTELRALRRALDSS
ncbi:hypothetical protein GCM10011519_25540 [Marmoricola endophyticus]|uniref:Transcriptional regulator n=1 Tax=Marmoricola endophyticus TaxID=2040280 RepID=A0A917F666_9ACTN|nr:BlaI/MecI/CopY family transcriptional regulator [Marmoricola endophyticus]GGF50476.1 hypothetical protein GCM10011519_25540 [Marmoricola endophyticus]